MTNLAIIWRNQEPKREQRYPRTWLMYTKDFRVAKAIITYHLQYDTPVSVPHVKRWETISAA